MSFVIIRKYYDDEIYLGISPCGGSSWFATGFFRAEPYLYPSMGKASDRASIERGEVRIITLDEFNIIRIMML